MQGNKFRDSGVHRLSQVTFICDSIIVPQHCYSKVSAYIQANFSENIILRAKFFPSFSFSFAISEGNIFF